MGKFNSLTGAAAGRSSSRKGVMHAENKKLKETLHEILKKNIKQIQYDLEKLEPKDRLNIIIKLMEFKYPKLTRAQVEQEAKSVNINFDNKW